MFSSRAEAAHSPFILNQVKPVLFSLQKLFSPSVFLCERSTTENECQEGWGWFPMWNGPGATSIFVATLIFVGPFSLSIFSVVVIGLSWRHTH